MTGDAPPTAAGRRVERAGEDAFALLLDRRDHADLDGFDWFPLKNDEATRLAGAHESAAEWATWLHGFVLGLHAAAKLGQIEQVKRGLAEYAERNGVVGS